MLACPVMNAVLVRSRSTLRTRIVRYGANLRPSRPYLSSLPHFLKQREFRSNPIFRIVTRQFSCFNPAAATSSPEGKTITAFACAWQTDCVPFVFSPTHVGVHRLRRPAKNQSAVFADRTVWLILRMICVVVCLSNDTCNRRRYVLPLTKFKESFLDRLTCFYTLIEAQSRER